MRFTDLHAEWTLKDIIVLSESCIEIYSTFRLKPSAELPVREETGGNRWCRLIPADWGVSEKLIIFLVLRKGSKGRKMPRGHCYLSIYLSLFLSPLLDPSVHIPHALPCSFSPFIIFMCPSTFWFLPFSLCCLSSAVSYRRLWLSVQFSYSFCSYIYPLPASWASFISIVSVVFNTMTPQAFVAATLSGKS